MVLDIDSPGPTSPTTRTFTILYFAAAEDYTTTSSETLPAPLPLRTLFPTLERRYPGITDKILKSCAVTVNLEYVDVPPQIESKAAPSPTVGSPMEELTIQPGDEVGIIPPVSSG